MHSQGTWRLLNFSRTLRVSVCHKKGEGSYSSHVCVCMCVCHVYVCVCVPCVRVCVRAHVYVCVCTHAVLNDEQKENIRLLVEPTFKFFEVLKTVFLKVGCKVSTHCHPMTSSGSLSTHSSPFHLPLTGSE